MAVDITRYSRLFFSPYVSTDGYEFWAANPVKAFPQQTDDETYVVQSGDRLDRIAYYLYGSPELWWVLAVANDLDLVPSALYVGQILAVPSRRYITQQLFKSSDPPVR